MNSLHKKALIGTLQGIFTVVGLFGYLFLLDRLSLWFDSDMPIAIGIFGPIAVILVIGFYFNELNRWEQLERSKKTVEKEDN